MEKVKTFLKEGGKNEKLATIPTKNKLGDKKEQVEVLQFNFNGEFDKKKLVELFKEQGFEKLPF